MEHDWHGHLDLPSIPVGHAPCKVVPFEVVSDLVEVDEVVPDDNLFMKALDDLYWVSNGSIPNLEFHVLGPHHAEVLAVGPLTWLTCSGPSHWLLVPEVMSESFSC